MNPLPSISTSTPFLAVILYLFCFVHFSAAGSNTTDLSKRGLLYISPSHPSDYNIFTTPPSPLTWYYNFSPNPSLPSSSSLHFIPMIHGTTNAAADVSVILSRSSSSSSSITEVLLYNEPDGTTSSGGSAISPHDAATTYLNTILPLRKTSHKNIRLSIPAVTGSTRGLEWLQSFNASCYAISGLNSESDCAFDFLAVHWYGDFPGLASWVSQLHALYPALPVWVTEFAMPQASPAETVAMMNASLQFLDQTAWVQRYAWFGAFRTSDANAWTGAGVSLLDDSGGLTEAGSLYLGGPERGFGVGRTSSDDGYVLRPTSSLMWTVAALAVVLVSFADLVP